MATNTEHCRSMTRNETQMAGGEGTTTGAGTSGRCSHENVKRARAVGYLYKCFGCVKRGSAGDNGLDHEHLGALTEAGGRCLDALEDAHNYSRRDLDATAYAAVGVGEALPVKGLALILHDGVG